MSKVRDAEIVRPLWSKTIFHAVRNSGAASTQLTLNKNLLKHSTKLTPETSEHVFLTSQKQAKPTPRNTSGSALSSRESVLAVEGNARRIWKGAAARLHHSSAPTASHAAAQQTVAQHERTYTHTYIHTSAHTPLTSSLRKLIARTS